MKIKKELIISILGIISLLLVTAGISVAFFSYAKNGVKENAITTGSITFLYTEVSGVGNGIIIDDAFPLSDEVGKITTGVGEYFDFKITSNTMSYVSVPYEVTVRKSSDSTLADEAVRIYLTELEETEEKEILLENYSNLEKTGKTDKYTEKTIYTDKVPINTKSYEKNFRLRMWLDENIDFSSGDYNGKTFSITVNVYANNDADIDTGVTTTPKDTSISNITANNMYLFSETEEEEIDYTLTVPKEVEELDIIVTPNNMNATASVEQVESITMLSNVKRLSTASNLGLEPGENYFKATVTSSDKSKTKDYILRVIREKDRDNTLLILEVDGYSLNPVFDPEVTNYTLSLEASSIEIKAETTSKVATITGIGTKELSWGENEFDITVTAQDGTIRVYKIVITNVKPTAPTLTGGSSSWVSTAPTISLTSAGNTISGVKHYEYYKSTTNTGPTDNTTATGTTTGDLTVTDEGITYVWYRTVSNNGFKSEWTTSPQVVKLDTTIPTITLNSSLPSSVTKGDSYAILASYTTNNVSGSTVSCNSNLNGIVTNTNQLTTLGYHTITCTVTTGAGLKATATKTITITYKAYSIKNLMTNGSFESSLSGWYNSPISQSTVYKRYGSYSGIVTSSNYQMFARYNIGTSGVTNHKLYMKASFLRSSTSVYPMLYLHTASAAVSWPSNAQNMTVTNSSATINTWYTFSLLGTAQYDYISNVMLAQANGSGVGNVYYDGVVIIDLTATFGSGNEPNKAWCDSHINYFDGTTTIYK